MIKIIIRRNAAGKTCGFDVFDHGDGIVCAAVSALALNAVNSVETLTDERFICDEDEKKGFLSLRLPDIEKGEEANDARLLLDSFALGARWIAEGYPDDVRVKYETIN
ncbi:MAG: ribosomal-processing cysteine protease Prp [Clostridiales bacterium]|jgi:uncharacterized protein YsxB (DUF464 family)|nr:ribosomal-processing cysteine protease Prp [Clostridiales bacterium]